MMMMAYRQSDIIIAALCIALIVSHATLANAAEGCSFTLRFPNTLSSSDPEITDLTFEYDTDFTNDTKNNIKVTVAVDPSSLSGYPVLDGTEDLLGTAFTLNGNANTDYSYTFLNRSNYNLLKLLDDYKDGQVQVYANEGQVSNPAQSTGITMNIEFNGAPPFDVAIQWSDLGGDKTVQIASFVISSKTSNNLDATRVLNNTFWYFRMQSTSPSGSAKMGGRISLLPNCSSLPCSDTNRPSGCSSNTAASCTTGGAVTVPQIITALGTACLPDQTWSVSLSVNGNTLSGNDTFNCSTAGIVKNDSSCFYTTLTFTGSGGPKCDNLNPTSSCATNSPYGAPCNASSVVPLTTLVSVLDSPCTQLLNLTYALFNATTGAALESVTCPPYGSTESVGVSVSDRGQACYNYTVQFTDSNEPPANCAIACTLAFSDASNATVTLTTNASISSLLPSLPHPSGGGSACTGRPVADGVVVGTPTTSADACNTTYTVEYSVSSAAPNCNATLRQTVVLITDQAPVFDDSAREVSFECSDSTAGKYPNVTSPEGVTAAQDGPDGSNTTLRCANNYRFERNFTATYCGNTAAFTQTVTVDDTSAPTFTNAPAAATVECGSSVAPNNTDGPAITTDNCGGAVNVTYSDAEQPAGGGACGKTITRTWTATDACGNAATHTQTITVSDTTKPTLTQVTDPLPAQCGSGVGPEPTVTASDNCDASVVPVFSNTTTPGGCPDRFTRVRTWTAIDDCGNSASVTQTVVVDDTIAPTFDNVPAPATLTCADNYAAAALGAPTAYDNCGCAVDLSVVDDTSAFNVTCLNVGTITRTWTAEDECGNNKTTLQVITVNDTIAPTFTSFPANATVECGNTTALAAAEADTPVARDDCGGAVTITNSSTPSSTPLTCGSTITRTWTATDCSGNSITRVQTITIKDTTKPMITPILSNKQKLMKVQCPANITAEPNMNASDACAGVVQVNLTRKTTAGGCPNRFTLTRTWTAADDFGNTAKVVQTIKVNDTTLPTLLNLPGSMVPLCIGSAAPRPTCSDNCGNCSVIAKRTANTTWQNGAGTETWTYQATDGCQTTPVTANTTTLVKFCNCDSKTALAGPSQWQYPTLSDTSAGIKGGPWYAIDLPRWGWGVRLNSSTPRVDASFWAGAAQNNRAKGVNGGNVTIERNGVDITVTFSLFPGSMAPVSGMHIAANCSQVFGTAFGNMPYLQYPRDKAFLKVTNPDTTYEQFKLKLPSNCAAGYVVVHNGAAEACSP